jgi:hypothetical protein
VELRAAYDTFRHCMVEHVSLKKYFIQIYKINGLLFSILLLLYIPIKITSKILCKIFEKI